MNTLSRTKVALPIAAPRTRARGFTLTELMAVVVIMGILATLALLGYRKYLNSAKASEAGYMVNGIRAAQEAYRSETLAYLDVSGTLDTYYPTANPTDKKTQWGGGTGEVAQKWRILNVTTDGAVYYGYSVVAGPPGEEIAPGGAAMTIDYPTPIEPWYIVQAKGDINGNGVFSYYMASSLENQVYWLHEGE